MTLIEAGRVRLLSQWIRHYGRWCSRKDMHVVLVGEGDTEPLRRTCVNGGVPYYFDEKPFDTHGTHARVKALTSKVFDWDGWHFNVDADEFFARTVDVRALAEKCESGGFRFVRTQMTDMIAEDGSLPEIPHADNGDIYDVFPREAEVTKKLVGGYDIKDSFLQNPLYGNHNAHDVDLRLRPPVVYSLHHFKWDATVIGRMKERYETEAARRRFPYWKHFRQFVQHYERHGKISLY